MISAVILQLLKVLTILSVVSSSPLAYDSDEVFNLEAIQPGDAHIAEQHRTKRDTSASGAASQSTTVPHYSLLSPQNRTECQNGKNPSKIAKNTTARLQALRDQFSGANDIKAYIIPTDDAHQSEYVSKYDERRPWISGFTGSAGIAVVTSDKAALWTDGRYFIQGADQLDCNWIFMKSGLPGVPRVSQWLAAVLPKGSKVGTDPNLLRISSWQSYVTALKSKGLEFVQVADNLIDKIWTTGRPPEPSYSPLIIHNITFSGKTVSDKISEIRGKIKESESQALVVTALDEVAWIFNLRGLDIPYNPMFFSYAIIELDNVCLYLRNMSRLTNDVQNHLMVNSNGVCKQPQKKESCINVLNYNKILEDVVKLNQDSNIDKIWVSPHSSAAIYYTVNETKRLELSSPILLMKAMKNHIEIENMKRCQIRDSAILIEFMAMLEPSVQKGDEWDEISAHQKLDEYRMKSKYSYGLSFDTISAFGSNGAIIHYSPQPLTKKNITTNGVYLLDSGGQYLDGTTDVTRSFHFGTPTSMEKEAYTRVLMGVIDLARAIWPRGTYGRDIDALARGPLWSVGLDYRHGTGHGIGMFLNVHEGPQAISMSSRGRNKYERPLYEGMFLSDEPGYYEKGKFGIRLETIVMVTNATTKYRFADKQYLKFEAVTLVPFESNLIDYKLLTNQQISWLNTYHKKCRDQVGQYLKDNGKTAAYEWLTKRTDLVPEHTKPKTSQCSIQKSISLTTLFIAATITFFTI